MISVHFQGKPFNIMVIQVYVPTTNAEEAEVEWFYENLQDLLELTPKRCPFHHRGLECKSRKPRDNWNNRQVQLWSTKWGRVKCNRVLSREHTGCTKHPFVPTQRTGLYTLISPDGQYWKQTDYVSCSWKWEALYSQQNQDLGLTVTQIMSSLLQNSGLNWRK